MMHDYYFAHRAAELVLFFLLPFGIIVHNYIRVAISLHLSMKDLKKLSSM